MSKNENTTFPRRFPTGQFDFVLANPPFNVNAVDKERLKDSVGPGRRFAFGLPRTDNANYLWIPLFYSARPTPRAAPGSSWPASDARTSEQELRQKLIGALREKRAGCRLIVPSLPTDKKTCLYSPIVAKVSLSIIAGVEQAGNQSGQSLDYSGVKLNPKHPATLLAVTGWFGIQRFGLG